MINEIIEAFFRNEKIHPKNNKTDFYFTKEGLEKNGKSDFSKDLISELILTPNNFEVYQPKNAWILTEGFENSMHEYSKQINNNCVDLCHFGAIILAREFLKRADEIYLHLKQEPAYQIIADLVGEENLK